VKKPNYVKISKYVQCVYQGNSDIGNRLRVFLTREQDKTLLNLRQKRLEQINRRGRRLSIIGFLQPLVSFVYGLVIGGVSRKSYIQMMELEAAEAKQSGRIRVIVQDNGPIHWVTASSAKRQGCSCSGGFDRGKSVR